MSVCKRCQGSHDERAPCNDRWSDAQLSRSAPARAQGTFGVPAAGRQTDTLSTQVLMITALRDAFYGREASGERESSPGTLVYGRVPAVSQPQSPPVVKAREEPAAAPEEDPFACERDSSPTVIFRRSDLFPMGVASAPVAQTGAAVERPRGRYVLLATIAGAILTAAVALALTGVPSSAESGIGRLVVWRAEASTRRSCSMVPHAPRGSRRMGVEPVTVGDTH